MSPIRDLLLGETTENFDTLIRFIYFEYPNVENGATLKKTKKNKRKQAIWVVETVIRQDGQEGHFSSLKIFLYLRKKKNTIMTLSPLILINVKVNVIKGILK